MYKSKRKNAEISDIIKVLNVYNTDNDILYQLIGTLKKVLFYVKKYKHIEISSLVSIDKESCFINANNNNYTESQVITYRFDRKVLCSCEQLINYIYSMYCMLYPDNKLSYNTLYDNASIKNIINNYYNENEVKENG
jgi:hypothetical protein